MRERFILFVFLLDQLTKYLILIWQPGLQFKGFGFLYSESRGYMFGLFMIMPYRRWLVVLSMIVFLFIIQLFFRFYWRVFRRNKLTYTAFSFIIGGFLGNFVDCIVFEYVTDIISVPFIKATNLADGFMLVGLGLLLLEFLINRDFKRVLFKLRPIKKEVALVAPLFRLPYEDIKKLLSKVSKNKLTNCIFNFI